MTIVHCHRCEYSGFVNGSRCPSCGAPVKPLRPRRGWRRQSFEPPAAHQVESSVRGHLYGHGPRNIERLSRPRARDPR